MRNLLLLFIFYLFVSSAHGELARFYQERSLQPVWMTEEGFTPCGKEAIQILVSVDQEGLDPQKYAPVLETLSTVDFSDSDARLAADQALTQAFLNYISVVGGERNNLRSFDKDLYLKEKSINEIDVLKKGLASKDCLWMRTLAPQHAQYQGLKRLLALYRQKQKEGGWPKLPADFSLQKGGASPQVSLLRQQLMARNFLESADADSLTFDEKVENGLKAFQLFHGLEPTGRLTPETLEALNVPLEARIKDIVLNMERWRWLPMDLGERYLMVNIPTYELYGMSQGKTVLKMPIIVGTAYRRTPIFTSMMTGIVLNPAWTVPHSIAIADKLATFSKNPSLLRARRYRLLSRDGVEVSPESVNWAAMSKNYFPYVLRQDPGAHNALGKIKFNIQNPFSIYIHGTPTQKLFKLSQRAKSSGCIRVKSPQNLALFALNGEPKWTLATLEKATQKTQTQSIFLPKQLPVYLTYMTVWIDEARHAFFAKDIYRKNETVEKLMKAQAP